MPGNGGRRGQGGEVGFLQGGEGGGGFEEVKFHSGAEQGVVVEDGLEKIGSEEAAVGALLHQQEAGRATKGGVQFIHLAGKKLAEDGARANGSEKITLRASSGLT